MNREIKLFTIFLLMNVNTFSQDSFGNFSGRVFDFDIHHDEKRILIPKDHRIELWNLENNTLIGEYDVIHREPIRAVAFSGDGDTFATGGLDSTIVIWKMKSKEPIYVVRNLSSSILTLRYSHDNSYILAGGSSKYLYVIDVNTGLLFKKLKGHENDILDIELVSEKRCISVGGDGKLILWDLENYEIIKSWKGHNDWIRDIAISDNHLYCITTSDDGTYSKWNLENGAIGKLIQSKKLSRNWLTSVDVIEENYYAYAGHNKKIIIETPHGRYDEKVGSIINKVEILLEGQLYLGVVATLTKGLVLVKFQ